jgi:hypothetical protein
MTTSEAPRSQHRGTVHLYATPTPTGITGAWACSCNTSGTSADPDAALAAHQVRLCGEVEAS